MCLENNRVHLYLSKKRAKVFQICDAATLSSRLCGYHAPSEPMTYMSSGNVMLITMATNDKKNYPGFRAQISQMRRGDRGKTGVLREWRLKLAPTPSLFTVHVWLVFYSHRVWRPAVRAKWEVHLTQLSKLLPSSNYVSVDDRGTVNCVTKICMTDIWMN